MTDPSSVPAPVSTDVHLFNPDAYLAPLRYVACPGAGRDGHDARRCWLCIGDSLSATAAAAVPPERVLVALRALPSGGQARRGGGRVRTMPIRHSHVDGGAGRPSARASEDAIGGHR